LQNRELKDGRLLYVGTGSRDKQKVMAVEESRDDGKTWDIEHEITLSPAMNDDLGYPASVQLDDGSILTVYYQIDKPGEKTCLMGTHWRLDK